MAGKHRKRPVQDNTNTAVAAALAIAAASGLFIPRSSDPPPKIASEMTSPAFSPVHVCSSVVCKPDGGRTFTDPPPPPPPPAPVVVTTTSEPPALPKLQPPRTSTPPPPPPEPVAPVFTPGVSGVGWEAMWAVIEENFPDAYLASGYRTNTCGQYHCKGLAIDIGGSAALMIQIDAWIYETYGDRVSQLIHAPGPYNVLDGSLYDYGTATLNDHYDHVHWAMEGPV